MSEFAVVAAALSEHASRLQGFAPEIHAARGRVAAGAGAAARTPAAGGIDRLSLHIHSSLAEFAEASDALHRAVRGAGDAYVRADACVKESAS